MDATISSVVNPTGILGPLLDDDPGTSGALVKRLLDGSIPMLPRVGFGIVDVRDVAELQVKAMETQGAGGRRSSLALLDGCRSRTRADALRSALPELAGKIPRHELPDWLVRLMALFKYRHQG